MKKSRIVFADYIKAFLVVTVVMSHTLFANEHIQPWLNIFSIPAFFFAAGFMMKEIRTKDELATAIIKRFRSLMVPYYLWGVIYAALTGHNVVYILYASYNSLEECGSLGALWFLPVMFLGIVFYMICQYLFKDRFSVGLKLAIMLICLIAVRFLPRLRLGYPMGLNIAILAFAFVLLGNVCFPLLKKYDTFVTSANSIVGLLMTASIMVICGVGVYVCTVFNAPFVKAVLVADSRYGNYWVFLLGAIFGIGFTCAFAILLEQVKWKKLGQVLSYLGQNSFAIYILHKPVVAIMRVVFARLSVPSWVALIVTCIVAVSSSCLAGAILNRYAPVLLGRTARQER